MHTSRHKHSDARKKFFIAGHTGGLHAVRVQINNGFLCSRQHFDQQNLSRCADLLCGPEEDLADRNVALKRVKDKQFICSLTVGSSLCPAENQ